MIIVGAFEAKTKLSELLDRVERGEEVQIMRYGKPVALLVSTVQVMPNRHADTLARFKATRFALAARLSGDGEPRVAADEIKGWIDDGRRQ